MFQIYDGVVVKKGKHKGRKGMIRKFTRRCGYPGECEVDFGDGQVRKFKEEDLGKEGVWNTEQETE
ncbi:MAG: hypothetical protein AAB791_00445 [Patescibacteria group bacterium]